jgi:hypothetical protein
MSYHLVSDTGETLGFSLKPPKWLRKMQPGKILAKAAPVLGIIAGAILIPGVGGVLAKGLTTAGGLAVKGLKAAGGGAVSVVKSAVAPGNPSPLPTISTSLPMVASPTVAPVVPSTPGSSAAQPAGGSSQLNSMLVPALIGVAALVVLTSNRRR